MTRTRPEWFTRARNKWSAEMAVARAVWLNCPVIDGAVKGGTEAYMRLKELRAQALALVLIERASR